VAKNCPEIGSISAELDLSERLRLFDFTADDLAVARKMWSIMEPDAHAICAIQLEQWRRSLGEQVNFERRNEERALQSRLDDLRKRYMSLDEIDWVHSAERIVAIAFAADISLTRILSMDSAGAAKTLESLSLRYDCSKEERQRINDVFFRMRSLECDIYSSLYTGYMAFDARQQRDHLADDFRRGVGLTVEAATEEGGALKAQAVRSAGSARNVLGKVSEVAAAAEQSAVAMRDAAQGAAGLIRAIEEVSDEVQSSADIATRAAAQAADAVVMSETLSAHARSIESILAMIRNVAGQTNLLALNATIEAARAGDAGRGFAVVAHEVKALAGQTAKATEEIGQNVGLIQSSTRNAVEAVREIGTAVREINDITSAIAGAVGQQDAATREISVNAQSAAQGNETLVNNIVSLRDAIGETNTAAGSVLSASHELNAMAETLSREVEKFFHNLRSGQAETRKSA
jgi:methyl-accepting chemotaxis protein